MGGTSTLCVVREEERVRGLALCTRSGWTATGMERYRARRSVALPKTAVASLAHH